MKIIGYVRSLIFDEDKCIIELPKLSCKRHDKSIEACIELNDLCEELVDYLEYQSRPMWNQFDGNTNRQFSIISLRELNNIYDEAISLRSITRTFCLQLDKIITQAETIASLGDLSLDSLYLEFTIS